MSVAKASGTMKVTNLSSNVAALVVFLLSGKIVIMLGIAASVFSIAGHLYRCRYGYEKTEAGSYGLLFL